MVGVLVGEPSQVVVTSYFIGIFVSGVAILRRGNFSSSRQNPSLPRRRSCSVALPEVARQTCPQAAVYKLKTAALCRCSRRKTVISVEWWHPIGQRDCKPMYSCFLHSRAHELADNKTSVNAGKKRM